MRFAVLATTAAAVVAVPFALGAAGPQMTRDEFLSAVRCAAYEDVTLQNAAVAEAKYELNTESLHQAPETVAAARAEVNAIARQAVNTQTAADQAMLREQRAAACSTAQIANSVAASNAV
jgi:hypothetical protein